MRFGSYSLVVFDSVLITHFHANFHMKNVKATMHCLEKKKTRDELCCMIKQTFSNAMTNVRFVNVLVRNLINCFVVPMQCTLALFNHDDNVNSP